MAVFFQAAAIAAHGVIHAYEAVLAARGEEEGIGCVFYAGGAKQHGESDALHGEKMRLHCCLEQVDYVVDGFCDVIILCQQGLPAITSQ